MHDIEREIITITGYKTQRKFSDRQDYLQSLFNAVQKLTDDDFDNLSNEAAVWANACVEAHNDKRDSELPDFDELKEEGIDDPDSEDEVEEDDEAEELEDEAEAEEPEDEAGDEEPEDDESEDDVEGAANKPEEEAEEEKPAPKAKKSKPAAKAKIVEKKPTKPKVAPKKVIEVEEDVILDKWGCMEGSKNSQALSMFEKGATASEIKNAIGGTYYNILSKMVKQGHKITKTGSLIKLTHMSEKAPKVSSPKGKTKK